MINDLFALLIEREKKEAMRNSYTYTLSYPENYPEENLAGVVFYVGKGTGYRIDRHELEARRDVQSPRHDVIRKIWAHGCKVVKRKEREKLTHQEAFDYESELIQKYRTANLTNVSYERECKGLEESIAPLNICLTKSFRQEIEASVIDKMRERGLEISSHLCHQYLQEICYQAIREHLMED